VQIYAIMDIKDIEEYDQSLLDILLKDRTTNQNIIWATNDYSKFGDMYKAECEIKAHLITNPKKKLIQPRATKSYKKKSVRTREKAEVFTPSWICNEQNNLIDEQWFGRKDVFNIQKNKSWEVINEKIIFPNEKGRTWKNYVDARRMEISCGEAPYLVSRYDTVTGKKIELQSRIGLLDRKMRVVNENVDNEDEWIKWAERAFQSIYGYEYQGDNLLLARENLLYTYFMFDGDELVYNPSLSKQIADFTPSGYVTDATVQSNLIECPVECPATASRVTAYYDVPPGTSITWSVYTGSWTPVWRIRGAPTPIVEYTPNGLVWVASPESLWKEHSETSWVGWRAELRTSNPSVTPKIKAPNPGTDTAVMLEKNSKPTVNLVLEPCYLTMTPTISWDFTDDDGDGQTEYDLRICDDMNYLYSYAAESNIPQHTMLPYEDPVTPSPLWNSGLNFFEFKIRVKDEVQWSDWETEPITFRAFERPRVVEVSVPGEEYEPPVINLPATHEVIQHGTDGEELPVTKAGGRITILVDSIGKVNLDPIHGVGSAIFPYLDQTATIGEVTLDATIPGPGGNKRWKITFWTSPDKTICPDNTIIGMDLIGNSDGYLPELNVQNFADGVARTKGSVYDNWNVVLQGRK
jgi:hypothetical protein